jgi:hypothetical protein
MLSTFFERVDKAAYRQQEEQADYLKLHPPPRAPTPPPKRPVGRPPLKRAAAEVLASAAAAEAVIEQLPEPKKRRSYTLWFDSPWLNNYLFE